MMIAFTTHSPNSTANQEVPKKRKAISTNTIVGLHLMLHKQREFKSLSEEVHTASMIIVCWKIAETAETTGINCKVQKRDMQVLMWRQRGSGNYHGLLRKFVGLVAARRPYSILVATPFRRISDPNSQISPQPHSLFSVPNEAKEKEIALHRTLFCHDRQPHLHLDDFSALLLAQLVQYYGYHSCS